jgi:hypothetical protein
VLKFLLGANLYVVETRYLMLRHRHRLLGFGINKDTKQVLKSVVLFYGIACGFAWLAWTALVLGPAGLKLHKHAVSFPISACIGTLGPFLACFISHRVQVGTKLPHMLKSMTCPRVRAATISSRALGYEESAGEQRVSLRIGSPADLDKRSPSCNSPRPDAPPLRGT